MIMLTRSRKKGFTLVEVLLVVVIVGVMAGMLVTRLSGRTQEAKITRAQADISGHLSLSLDLFEQDTGRYPTTDEGLNALVTDPGVAGWKGPYLKSGLKPDPWDSEYVYSYNNADGTYDLLSPGPDTTVGTDDDIRP